MATTGDACTNPLTETGFVNEGDAGIKLAPGRTNKPGKPITSCFPPRHPR
jgi:hypothetical protein